MVKQFKRTLVKASRVVNSTLGDVCTYTRLGELLPAFTGDVIINKNVPVHDEFKILIGYGVKASILKEDLPNTPSAGDTIVTEDGETFIVNIVLQETSSKWYVTLESA